MSRIVQPGGGGTTTTSSGPRFGGVIRQGDDPQKGLWLGYADVGPGWYLEALAASGVGAIQIAIVPGDKKISVTYDVGDTLEEIKDTAPPALTVVELHGTNLQAAPEAPPFERGVLVRPDDYADSVALSVAQEQLAVTLGRADRADLTGNVNLSAISAPLRAELAGTGTFVTYATETVANANSAFSTARSLGFGINVDNVDRIRLQFGTSNFEFAISEWLRLPVSTAGVTIPAASRMTVVQTGGTDTIRIGRGDGNFILVQFGTYTAPTTNILVTQQQLRYSGGLIDLRVREAGGRHRVCMITRSTTQPAAPSADHFYDGTSIHDLTGSPWVQAGVSVPSGTDKIWFAFGEAKIDPLSSLWELESSWVVVDSTLLSSTIQYGTDWTGPFNASEYTFTLHRYARITLPNGDQIVRRIGNDLSAGRREWIPIAQWGWGPLSTAMRRRTPFITLDPTEYQWLRLDMNQNGRMTAITPFSPVVLQAPIAADAEPTFGNDTWGAWFNEGAEWGIKAHNYIDGYTVARWANRMNINFYGTGGLCTEIIAFNRGSSPDRSLDCVMWVY